MEMSQRELRRQRDDARDSADEMEAQLAQVKAVIRGLLESDQHMIDVFYGVPSVIYPLKCRRDPGNCEVTATIDHAYDHNGCRFSELWGRFRVSLLDGDIVVGTQVADAADPVLDALERLGAE